MNEIFKIIFSVNFIIGAIIAWGLTFLFFSYKDNRRKRKDRKRFERYNETNLKNHDNQLRFVEGVDLQKRQILNSKEVIIFYKIENYLNTLNEKYRVMAQVSLGEVINTLNFCNNSSCYDKSNNSKCSDCSEKSNAYSSFNSKRFDLLIIDARGYPKVAIEYQGAGHYQGNAWKRDEVKRLVCKKAKIDLLEINQDETAQDYMPKIKMFLKQRFVSSYSQ